jgi:enamine deaminase RidA (YjgF/YER057c/UK114 family)
MEAQFRVRRPGAGFDRQIIDGPGAGFGFQSAAVRLGPLVWISSLVAAQEHRGDAASEIHDVLDKIASTCANAGTDLSNLLRVRVLLGRGDDAGAVANALRAAVPKDPPTVCVAVLPAPLPTPNATIAIDAVAFAAG